MNEVQRTDNIGAGETNGANLYGRPCNFVVGTQQVERKCESEGDRLSYVLHKLLAHGSNFLAQGGTEHHNLLVVRGSSEDVLDVFTHICINR
jgi:hypothetical protein